MNWYIFYTTYGSHLEYYFSRKELSEEALHEVGNEFYSRTFYDQDIKHTKVEMMTQEAVDRLTEKYMRQATHAHAMLEVLDRTPIKGP